MKKSIFIGVLCALMLFAFTACEQSVPQIPSANHTLSEVQYVSGPLTYTVGEEFDPAAYQVKLVYLDNLGSETVSGEIYLNAESWPTPATMEDDSARIALKSGEKTVCYVTVYNAEVVLDITNAVTTVESDAQKGASVPTEGITAKLVSKDGTETEYDMANITATYAGKDTAATVVDDNGYSVSYVKDGKEVAGWILGKATEVGAANTVRVEYYVDGTKDADSTISNNEYNLKKTVNVKFIAVDASGNDIGEIQPSSLVVLSGTVSGSYEIKGEAQTAEFYYRESATGKAIKNSISIGTGKDYATGLSGQGLSEKGKAGVTISTSTTTIDASYFTANVTMASGTSTAIESSKISIIGGDTSIESTDKAGDYEYTVQFEYTDENGKSVYDVQKYTIVVKAAQA